MATDNPTGDSPAVRIWLRDDQKRFIRRTASAALEGARDDLKLHVAKEEDPPALLLREERGFAGLLGALELGWAVPGADRDLCNAVYRLLESVDRQNEYERASFEHDSLDSLRRQLYRETAR